MVKTKREAVRVLFVSSFTHYHRKRHFTGAVSSFSPIKFILLFFFQHIKNKTTRYINYLLYYLLIIIYCNYCIEGLCAVTFDISSSLSKITGKQMCT